MTSSIPFLKMHGAGNDFVIIDERTQEYTLKPHEVRLICDRRIGIGCDQLVLMREAGVLADVKMVIFNADGSEAQACGNATRCVGRLVMEESGKEMARIETLAGILECAHESDLRVKVEMGAPRFDWREIPLAEPTDTMRLPITTGKWLEPVAVNMGNPHAVFFVTDVASVELEKHGPSIENNALFPERVNVEFAEISARNHIALRVWERGSGETQACGTGACAAMVAARLRGLVDEAVDVHLPGGVLRIEWQGTQENASSVYMTGPVCKVAKGEWMRP